MSEILFQFLWMFRKNQALQVLKGWLSMVDTIDFYPESLLKNVSRHVFEFAVRHKHFRSSCWGAWHDYKAMWSDDIANLLAILRLGPAKYGEKTKGEKNPYRESTELVNTLQYAWTNYHNRKNVQELASRAETVNDVLREQRLDDAHRAWLGVITATSVAALRAGIVAPEFAEQVKLTPMWRLFSLQEMAEARQKKVDT